MIGINDFLFTDEKEIIEAKHVVINGLREAFSTNMSSAQTIIFLARYGLDASYIQKRMNMIKNITKADIEHAAQKILNENKLITIRAGRLEV